MTQPLGQQWGFQVEDKQPVIATPLEGDSRQVARYFVDEAAADRELAAWRSQRHVRHLAGAWARIYPAIDWDELADELECIRHASIPTPPFDLDP